MRINIVRPTDGWVLQRIAEGWQMPGAVCSSRPDPDAVNLWVNYALFASVGKFRKTRCDVGWFTHRESGSHGKRFDRIAAAMDWCVAMCDKTAALLPANKTTVIHSAPDPQFIKSGIVIGIVGREYPRKRLGWRGTLAKIDGVEIRFTGGELDFEELPEFYRGVDYVLVLSDNEGGPMCVPEAIAIGKPIIAPDVGWCWDYPVIRYGGIAQLHQIVSDLRPKTISEESHQLFDVIKRAVACS